MLHINTVSKAWFNPWGVIGGRSSPHALSDCELKEIQETLRLNPNAPMPPGQGPCGGEWGSLTWINDVLRVHIWIQPKMIFQRLSRIIPQNLTAAEATDLPVASKVVVIVVRLNGSQRHVTVSGLFTHSYLFVRSTCTIYSSPLLQQLELLLVWMLPFSSHVLFVCEFAYLIVCLFFPSFGCCWLVLLVVGCCYLFWTLFRSLSGCFSFFLTCRQNNKIIFWLNLKCIYRRLLFVF